MDRSLSYEAYSYISVKSHNDEYYFSKEPLLKMIAYAHEHGIPVWTARMLLDFLKMRDESFFSNINWSKNQLSFRLNSSIKNPNGLTFMLPAEFQGKKIKWISKNGNEQAFIIRSVKSYEYAMVTVESGNTYDIIAVYMN